MTFAFAAEFDAILDGQRDDAAITDFLIRSIDWMGDADALVAGAAALRARMVRVRAPSGAIDVCGTGGDGAHTLNISTAVTFVVAGCGVPVAKHGNRAMSSRSGAADVLEALGVRLSASPATLEACLADIGVAFLFAQNHHPAMRHVAGPRRALGRRTLFNLLGPLSNPAGVTRQLIGVFDAAFAPAMVQALHLLGATAGMIVHGAGGWDEATLAGETLAVSTGAAGQETQRLRAESFGLRLIEPAALRGGDAAFNARALHALLHDGDADSAYGAIVIANAALALRVADCCETIAQGAALARHALTSRAAAQKLKSLIAFTQEHP
jgi:anthranilate phosphoribosyltransferase